MKIEQFTGLVNTLPPERLAPGDLVAALNVDIDDSGAARRRAGQQLLRTGASHSLFAEGDWCVFCEGGTLYRLDETLAVTVLATGLEPNTRLAFVVLDGRLYAAGGDHALVVETDGTVRSFGLPVPPPPSARLVGGTLEAGQRQMALTWIRSDGQESGASEVATLTLDSPAGLEVQLPTPTDPDVVAIGLYLTEPDGQILYEAGAFAAGTESATLVEPPQLAVRLGTLDLCGPPAGAEHLGYFNGHMLVAAGSALYPSEAFGPELFDPLDAFSFESRITLLGIVASGVFVATETETGFLAGDTVSEWRYTRLLERGAVPGTLARAPAHLAALDGVVSGDALWWVDTAGCVLVALATGEILNLTERRYRIADPAARGAGVIRTEPGTSPSYLVAI